MHPPPPADREGLGDAGEQELGHHQALPLLHGELLLLYYPQELPLLHGVQPPPALITSSQHTCNTEVHQTVQCTALATDKYNRQWCTALATGQYNRQSGVLPWPLASTHQTPDSLASTHQTVWPVHTRHQKSVLFSADAGGHGRPLQKSVRLEGGGRSWPDRHCGSSTCSGPACTC